MAKLHDGYHGNDIARETNKAKGLSIMYSNIGKKSNESILWF